MEPSSGRAQSLRSRTTIAAMTKSVVRRCPVCGHAYGEVLHHQRFVLPEGYPLAASHDVVSCVRCGLGYADVAGAEDDYDRFYSEFSKYADDHAGFGGDTAVDGERLRQTAVEIGKAVTDRHSRILDVGCANGGLLVALRELGYVNLCGVDPSSACVANATRRSGAEVYVGSLSRIPEGVGRCDCLILSHVLEHVLDPRASLASVRSVMKPGAWLYCETPDATRYSDYLFSPFQDFNTEHINHFSLVSLANLLRRCGFALYSSGVKEISISPGKPYPALFVISKMSLLLPEYNMERDEVTRVRLLDYVVRSGQLMRHIEDTLTRALSNASEVLVWGTGQLTWKLLADGSLALANIAAFVNSNPASHGLTLCGRPILGPSQVESGSRPIVVASLMHQSAIVERIRQLGLANPVIVLAPGAAGNCWDSAA